MSSISPSSCDKASSLRLATDGAGLPPNHYGCSDRKHALDRALLDTTPADPRRVRGRHRRAGAVSSPSSLPTRPPSTPAEPPPAPELPPGPIEGAGGASPTGSQKPDKPSGADASPTVVHAA